MSEEQNYNEALDAMCAEIRAAIFKARDAGISPQAMWAEADDALDTALLDAEDEEIAG